MLGMCQTCSKAAVECNTDSVYRCLHQRRYSVAAGVLHFPKNDLVSNFIIKEGAGRHQVHLPVDAINSWPHGGAQKEHYCKKVGRFLLPAWSFYVFVNRRRAAYGHGGRASFMQGSRLLCAACTMRMKSINPICVCPQRQVL